MSMTAERMREEHKKQSIVFAVKCFHFAASLLIFYYFWLMFRYGNLAPERLKGYRYNYFTVAAFAVVLVLFNRTYNSYLLGYSRIRELAFSQALSHFFSVVAVYIMVSFAWNHLSNPLWLLAIMVPLCGLDILWSYFGNWLYFRLYPRKKTIFIYRNEVDKRRFGLINGKPKGRLYKIDEELQFNGKFSEIRDKLTQFDAVFVAGVNSRCRNGILKYCKEEGIPGFFLPHVGDVIMQESKHIQSLDSPVLYVTRTSLRPEYRMIKRGFDFLVSFIAIVVLSPLMIVTAIAIRLYDGGPAIYSQVRLTKDGKTFKIYKFRSMRVDAEKDGVARLSSGDKDDRITPIGKFVRKCRLDELPQLFNILKGDMSIVGPRPERPEIAEQYYKKIPDFKLRLQVKAGLTGYAQVYGRYNTEPYEKLEFDLLYINNMSVMTDLKLMFATVGILFSSDSTKGVSAGQTTAMDYEEDGE